MYDVIIIGLGCAAYTAAIYTARYKLRTLIVGAEEGGMGVTAAEVGNWPGIIEIAGPDLMENFRKHALSYEGVTHRSAWVTGVERVGKEGTVGQSESVFRLTLENGETVEGKTVIFATGSEKRKLGIPGEKEFLRKGVTYCATCDAFFYKGKDVAVLGGGDSAVEGAAIAAQVCRTVYLIHRRKEFKAEPYWVDKVKEKKNIVFVLERNAREILGDTTVKAVKLDTPWEGREHIPVAGIFIEIGSDPASKIAMELGCAVDERRFLMVTPNQETTVPGAFAAGDVTNASNYFAQFATAAGEGSVAANSVFSYLQGGGGHSGAMG